MQPVPGITAEAVETQLPERLDVARCDAGEAGAQTLVEAAAVGVWVAGFVEVVDGFVVGAPGAADEVDEGLGEAGGGVHSCGGGWVVMMR